MGALITELSVYVYTNLWLTILSWVGVCLVIMTLVIALTALAHSRKQKTRRIQNQELYDPWSEMSSVPKDENDKGFWDSY